MQRDLTEINEMAAEIRRTGHAALGVNVKPVAPPPAAPSSPSGAGNSGAPD